MRFDPTVNGNGGGGAGNGGADRATIDESTGDPVLVSFDPVTATNAANRDYAQPVYAALDGPFSEASSGFVGAASDGLVQLDADHALTTTYDDAIGGNVVQTARVELKGDGNGGGKAILALGFGASQEEAVETAEGSLATGFARAHAAYVEGWRQYDRSLTKPRTERLPGIAGADQKRLEDAYYLSANVIKASEDKTFPGAIVASLASPWGQAVSAGDPANTYFGSYREVFARDLYESWTGLVAAGDLATARAATLFLFERQQLPDGSMPRNSLVNGKVAPDSFGTQLDETAYPILMAYQLGLTDPSLYADHIKPAANFVASRGPAFGVERWEEQSGFSPSTIAAEIAGLVAAAELARANGDAASAAVWLGVADSWQRQVKDWTVTTSGPHASRYFIRLSKTGDPNAAISYNVGNGGPTLDQREVIDAGLPRAGTARRAARRRPGHRPLAAGRGRDDQVDDRARAGLAPLQRRRLRRPGLGRPAVGAERPGHRPSLAGALGRARGARAGHRRPGRGGFPAPRHEPVRLRRRPDPRAELGAARSGAVAVRHRPHARVDRLRERRRGRLGVAAHVVGRVVRAARGQPRGRPERRAAGGNALALRRPHAGPDDADRDEPGGQLVRQRLARHRHRDDRAREHRVRRRDEHRHALADHGCLGTTAPTGSFSVDVAVTGGTNVLNVVAVSPSGATAQAKRTVLFDFVPGTLLLDVTDPDGDDNGPGNYAYPTSANFHPGAFDIQRFQVYDSGADVTFRLQTRDLSETFGSPLGAQLVDVYVRVPGASTTSTAAAHPLRNFTISPTFAWSRLIQVQGFGQRYVDATRDHARDGVDQREPDLPLHHVQRPEGVARHARAPAGASRSCSPARTASARTRPAASLRRRRTSSSASARRRAPIRTARSTRPWCRRRST